MKLTAQQRADVVELLRCAADLAATSKHPTTTPFFTAAAGYRREVSGKAWLMRTRLVGPYDDAVPNDQYVAYLLEAAMRVEEGRWP